MLSLLLLLLVVVVVAVVSAVTLLPPFTAAPAAAGAIVESVWLLMRQIRQYLGNCNEVECRGNKQTIY
jgi:hypothetical protein